MTEKEHKLNKMKNRSIWLPFGWNIHCYRRDVNVRGLWKVDISGGEMTIWAGRSYMVITKLPF